jgi:hypothetical protein
MYSNEDFKKKYLKYKMKYLELKDSYLNIEMKGGDKPLLTNYNINLFNPSIRSQNLMEPYLNPVYGLYMCESGFITNSYYLYSAFKDEKFDYVEQVEYAKKIKRLSRDINGSIQPNDEVSKIKPIDIGAYIALLYICKDNKDFINISNGRLNVVKQYSFSKDKNYLLKTYIETLNNYIKNVSLIRTTFPINNCNNMTDIDFHIILYCLWWVSNNDQGIRDYYNGINEVINICNDLLSWSMDKPIDKYEPIDLQYTNPDSDCFEKLVLDDITKKSFHKYEMQYPQHFCLLEKKPTYPDCGEITARNLINLICFKSETDAFDIEILKKFGAIDKLIEYYTVFDTFKKQSAEPTVKIYNQDLNAKDAWSYLIIFYANNNLRFNKSCNNGLNYELLDGMSADSKTTNFFQLIKNLLSSITKWDDLNTESGTFKIVSNDTDKDGFGKIVIKISDCSNIIIFCKNRHYDMHIDKKAIKYGASKLTESHKFKIDILLNNEIVINDISNFLWINWNSELLMTKIDFSYITSEPIEIINDITLRKKLLELLFTDKFNSDTRRRIEINPGWDDDFFTYFVDAFKTNDKINEYTYVSNDFEFVKRLPQLTNLNCGINWTTSTIILDPLSKSNISTIGDNFLMDCSRLTNIDLTPLSKITSIGNNFLKNCNGLTEIIFPSVSNVTSIGNDFLYSCSGLTNIDLTPLSKVTSIGHNFLFGCKKLTEIDLTHLSKVTSIGYNFLYDCRGLENIDLTPLSNVTSIDNSFLNRCSRLENIDLTPLSNVTSIGNSFLDNCSGLKNIDLTSLSKVTSIGYNFLYNCSGLTNINLSTRLQLSSVGRDFLVNCISLKYVNGKPIPYNEPINKYIFEKVKSI